MLIGEALSVDSAEPGEPKAEFGQPAAGPRTAADVAVAVEAEERAEEAAGQGAQEARGSKRTSTAAA